MIERKLFRVEANDPSRCEAVVKMGQCPYRAIEGQKMCPMHTRGNEEGQAIRNYRLGKWQSRVEEFADNNQVKSLREEIGLLRLILEETIQRCQEPTDLIIYSSKITDTILKIEKLVGSCHRLELSTGALLDKAAVLQIAGTLLEIIGRHIKDEVVMDHISTDFLQVINETKVNQDD